VSNLLLRVVALVVIGVSPASAQPALPTTPAGRVLTAWRLRASTGWRASSAGIDNVRLIPIER
jgi:hypothetical protein